MPTLLTREHFPRLFEMEKPPQRLHCEGAESNLELLHRLETDGLSVVGTRDPSPWSVEFTAHLVSSLPASTIVVSGFARGIDGAAHEAALRNGLKTIAILGCGLDINYPSQHAGLKKRIIEDGGLVISEFESGAAPLAHHFLHRNRLVGQWTRATLLIEAQRRSGALNTAHWALTRGRELYVVPCTPDSIRFGGNQRLLESGHGKALWGSQSLSELFQQSLFSRSFESASGIDQDFMLKTARHLAKRKKHIEMQTLMDRLMDHSWSADRFFVSLESLIRSGRVSERDDELYFK